MSDTLTLKELFELASKQVKTLTVKPNKSTLLELYSLYKQSTLGECTTSKPWAFQLESSAKWNAWNNLGNLSKARAMEEYIALVNDLFLQEKKTN